MSLKIMGALRRQPDTMTMEAFLRARWENYEMLYNVTVTGLPEDWLGWDLLKQSHGHVREK